MSQIPRRPTALAGQTAPLTLQPSRHEPRGETVHVTVADNVAGEETIAP
jgi:hypothetical protein